MVMFPFEPTADYTASGRCLVLIETYLQNLQRIYANTHAGTHCGESISSKLWTIFLDTLWRQTNTASN